MSRARCWPSTGPRSHHSPATCPSGVCWFRRYRVPSVPVPKTGSRLPAATSARARPWATWRSGAASTRSPRPFPPPSWSGWSRTGIRSPRDSPWSGCSRSPHEVLAAEQRARSEQSAPAPGRIEPPMRLTEGAPGSRILAFGGYQPTRVVTNDELATTIDTSDEWIRSRVGIASRRIAAPDETLPDMAAAAGGKALAASGLSPADIDLVIVATCTPEAPIPNTAATVATRLGIVAPGAYDLNAACAGFCYALATASDAVRGGTARNVLVIGAEKLSQWVDWTDRSTCIIFADGAGAALVSPVAEPDDAPGIGPVVWGSAGEMADKISIADRNSFIVQEGQAVFRWATTALHPVAKAACERAGVDPASLAAFIPHQANLRIIEAIARKLGAPQARVADDIVHSGNTSSASIPLALSAMIERGELASGDKALLLGFGAGISYAAQVVTVP